MKTEKEVAEIIFDNLDYAYCNNCRFQNLSEEEAIEKCGYWGCEDCHWKYNGWGISIAEAERLAKIISE